MSPLREPMRPRYRAIAERDFAHNGVAIQIAEESPQATRILAFTQQEYIEVPGDSYVAPHSPLVLPEDAARAVYEALAEHFSGVVVNDARTLRADLEHERDRVDRFIGFLIGGRQ